MSRVAPQPHHSTPVRTRPGRLGIARDQARKHSTPEHLAATFRLALHRDNRKTCRALHAATSAFVAALKSDGLSPERVLIMLKAAIASEGRWLSLVPACTPDRTPVCREQQVYTQVFSWYLRAYFGIPNSGADHRSCGPLPIRPVPPDAAAGRSRPRWW